MAKKTRTQSLVGGAQSTQAKFLRAGLATLYGGVVPGVSPGTLGGLPGENVLTEFGK
jgi:hypothetical protein